MFEWNIVRFQKLDPDIRLDIWISFSKNVG